MKMMKRTLCLVLALVMLVGMFTVGASAEETSNETAYFTLYGVYPDGTITANPIHVDGFKASNYATLAVYVDAVTSFSNLPADYTVDRTTFRKIADVANSWPNWKYAPVAGDSFTLYVDLVPTVSEPITHTVTFMVGSEKHAEVPVEDGKTVVLPSDPTKKDHTFDGWTDANGVAADLTAAITGDLTVYASWKANEIPSTPIITPAVPNNIYGLYEGAVNVACASKHHDALSYAFQLTIDDIEQIKMDGPFKAYVYLDDTDFSTFVSKYNGDTRGKHTFVTKVPVVITLELKPSFHHNFKWVVTDAAEMDVTCDCDHWCGDWCGGLWHKHTVTYNDGVKGDVIFKDITYTVKHGAKTPVPAAPVRVGYKFAGWTPAVSSTATKCVTYYATWVDAKGPALTKEHVAYLKGYGAGLVKPEGEITRAEAITMLYRLMDKASVKEYYTTYNAFSDVAKDAWYNDAVSTLANAGVLRYKTGLLNPNEAITRAEFFYMLTKFSNVEYTGKCTFVDVPSTYWAYEELTLAQYLGWIKGYGGGVLYPDDTITRAEVAASLNRVLGRTACKVKDTKNFIDNPVNAWYYDDIVEASIAH